jgi:hypothetical protein
LRGKLGHAVLHVTHQFGKLDQPNAIPIPIPKRIEKSSGEERMAGASNLIGELAGSRSSQNRTPGCLVQPSDSGFRALINTRARVTSDKRAALTRVEKDDRLLRLDAIGKPVQIAAYNGSHLLASLPARTTIRFTGAASMLRGR